MIFAIRHTSVDVPSGICYGQSNVPLASSYMSELEIVKKNLPDISDVLVFTSPLDRCATLAKDCFPNIPIIKDSRLQEMSFGIWEMQDWNAIYSTKEGWLWFNNWKTQRCPNGESNSDLILRIQLFLQENADKSCIVFTHAGVIRILYMLLHKKTSEEIFKLHIPFGSCHLFE